VTPEIGAPSTLVRIGAGALCILGLLGLGLFAGALLGGRVFGSGGMGWDQLADALGGAIVGIIAGIVVSVWAIRKLPIGKQAWLGASSLVVAAGAAAVIRILQS